MSVDEKHPEYTSQRVDEWAMMRHTASGQTSIKSQGEKYLPKPGGFKFLEDNGGGDLYTPYKGRAQFPEMVSPTISGMVGVIHDKEIQVELPSRMEYLLEQATGQNGMTLPSFHRHITRELLEIGRYGVSADAPTGGGEPYLVGWGGERIINWDADFFVVDDSGYVRDGYAWNEIDQHRVFRLNGGFYEQLVVNADGQNVVEQTIQGGGGLSFVPMHMANALGLSASIETPPIIGVARAAIANYQLSADYRHQLFMSGQETFVTLNAEAPPAIGAGVVVSLQSGDAEKPADAKFVSPSCTGIASHKAAMEDNKREAAAAGARMFAEPGHAQESGEARRLRFAAETATLLTVASSSCAVLEKGLRSIAAMLNLNEEDVSVTPPTDLMDRTMTPADAEALMRVWQGGGISFQTYYENLQRGGIASEDRTFEEEWENRENDEFRETPGVEDL